MTLGASRTVSGAVTAKEWDYLELHDSKGGGLFGGAVSSSGVWNSFEC